MNGAVIIRAELGRHGTTITELSGTEPWRPCIEIGAGGSLVWLGEPLIVAAGSPVSGGRI